ncbi:hypothetical protein AND_006591 [Anopheles darlingi]|uniref:Uncharacterized protein n=1 Tax=Anopheles darlingi TaxID=43151 RepID=W5JCB0_ANODA|nr:hypothetical protein AND_006591 [Anopheles darlingi]
MVTPIHRFQTVDCTRPHFYRQQQQQQQQQQQPQPSQVNSGPSVTHNTSTHASQQHQHQQQQQTQSHHHHHHHHPHNHNHNLPALPPPSHQSQSQQPLLSTVAPLASNQQVHQVQLHSGTHYNSHSTSTSGILPAPSPYPQSSSPSLQPSASPNHAHNYHVPVSMNHIYSASAQASGAEIEHSSIGTIGQHAQQQQHVGHDAQLLPAHLKCGMWASLALATVFVAGAKFYFDHQGTGLEVLIFCAFSATFFLAACTVSLWRRPRDLQIPGNNVISETISNAEQSSLQNNPELMSSQPSPLLNGSVGHGIPGGMLGTASHQQQQQQHSNSSMPH